MNEEQKKYDVFISYSHDDWVVAEGVYDYLKRNKIKCFIDDRDIPKGVPWSKMIPYAIRDSKLMLAVFSKNFNISEQTDNEIAVASNRKIPMLVFRITDDSFDGTKEYFLTKSNWIEAFPEPEKCFGELYDNICILLGINDTSDKSPSSNVAYQRKEAIKGEEYVRRGLEIIKDVNGDHELAAYNFRKAAMEGHPEGEYRLALAYDAGDGMPHNRELAFSWFEKAASHGHARAMGRLAEIYRYGIGVERNTMRALELYTQAAEAGDGISMKSLGRVFATGELGVQDSGRSLKYYEQALDALYEMAIGKNDAEAQYSLGSSYFDGEGVQQNYTQAVKMFQRAADNASSRAYNALGICYGAGYGVAKDSKKGFELQLKSAELGSPIAMGNVAQAYLYGTTVEKDEQKYIEWIRKSADCGHVAAQMYIGRDYMTGRLSDKDVVQARKWLEKSANGGCNMAMCLLGDMYNSGDISDDDGAQKALQLYKRAAISGNLYACYCLADCYYYGKGTAENDVEALRWYGKVAEVYEAMKAKDETSFLDDSGAGLSTFRDFDSCKDTFAAAFENLSWIYRNSKTVEHDSFLAIKWGNISKIIAGETDGLENADEIVRLEESVRDGCVDALDDLLDVYNSYSDVSKIKEWATYAVEHKILVKKADRCNGRDHLEWVLKNAVIKDGRVYVDYLKAHLDAGGSHNCTALYNAVCEEYKKGNLQMTEQYWKIVRDDAVGLLGLEDGCFNPGCLRERRDYFNVLFPEYNPQAVLDGDFSDERNFKLFYVANTGDFDDWDIGDYGVGIFDLLKKDESYAKVLESENRSIALFGDLGLFLVNFISTYDNLCAQNPTVRKVCVDAYEYENIVPICSPGKVQRYLMQSMKALISLRELYKDKWSEIAANLTDWEELLDIVKKVVGEDLQLLLLSYLEIHIEAKEIFKYVAKLNNLRREKDKTGIALELNNYVKRLEKNGIPHDLPTYAGDNLPEWMFSDSAFADDVFEQPVEDVRCICNEGGDSVKEPLEELPQSSNSFHIVRSGGKCGFANEKGDVLIPCQWTKAEEFADGVALVWNGGKMGAINELGEYYFPCKISCSRAKYLGHNIIKAGGAHYTLYDLNGGPVSHESFYDLGDNFVDGYMYAVKYRMFGRNKVGRIDVAGRFIED